MSKINFISTDKTSCSINLYLISTANSLNPLYGHLLRRILYRTYLFGCDFSMCLNHCFKSRNVSEIMKRDEISITGSTTLEDVVAIMIEKGLKQSTGVGKAGKFLRMTRRDSITIALAH